MLHTTNPIIKHKAGLLNLAEKPGNVSKACKLMGVSRDTFYRYQELIAEGGVDALINKSRQTPNPDISFALKTMQIASFLNFMAYKKKARVRFAKRMFPKQE